MRPSIYPDLSECFICGKPAAYWTYCPHRLSIFPHRFISGRCEECHPGWIENWKEMGVDLVVLNNLQDSMAMEIILEVMWS